MPKNRVYWICASIFPLMVCSGMVYSILSLFIADLGASKTQIGMIFTVGSMGGAVAAPALGRVADKAGSKLILLASMILFSATFFLYSLARNLFDMYVIQVLEGAAWSALGVSGVALVTDAAPRDRKGEAIGVYNMTWYLGWIVGPGLGGFLSDTLGFRKTFLLCFALILIGIGLIIKVLKEHEPKS